MDIFFTDASEIPLPPGEVRIRNVEMLLSSDKRRLKVHIEIDPFQKPPDFNLELFDPFDEQVCQADVFAAPTRFQEFTLHFRHEPPPGEYNLRITLGYLEISPDSDEGKGVIRHTLVDAADRKLIID